MKQILYFFAFILLSASCRSRECNIEHISREDKKWMIPMKSFATIGFKGDKNHQELFRSTYSGRSFSGCSGWLGSGNKYEIIDTEFDKDSCDATDCHMRMIISRNTGNKKSRVHLDFLDFSRTIPSDKDEKTADKKVYVPRLQQHVSTWLLKNEKTNAEVTSVNYSKKYGIVRYQKRDGEIFVMDSLFSRPYIQL